MDLMLALADTLVIVRAIHFAATLLVGGTLTFAALAAEPVLRADATATALRRRCDRMVLWALLAAIASGAAWLVMVSGNILDQPMPQIMMQGGWLTVAGGTRFGQVMSVRLLLALVLIIVLLRQPARRGWQAALSVPLVALIALGGHAGATPGAAGDIHKAVDAAHLLAAAAWVGALPAFALLLQAAARHDGWRAIAVQATARFSRIGTASVVVLLGTGIASSLFMLARPDDLIDTRYGRLLSVKIALFLGMLAIAAVNRFRLTARLPQRAATVALLRNIAADIVLAAGVVFTVAALGTTQPGDHAAHQPAEAQSGETAFVHLHTPEIMADVTVNAANGRAIATIRVMREDASVYPAETVTFALDPADAGAVSAPLPARRAADGTWVVEDLQAAPGISTARVIVGTGSGSPTVLDGPIVIGP